ncbi:MAG TPA: hypothetical protein VK750_08385 [Cytophagaceae bacterium]|jgi:hypothetical protein|nr:hypothetical protein [Cytophagaceae bacterium]
MSFSDKQNIDDLFKGLQDESLEPDTLQFEDMDIRLEKMRFYRFGWKHFNIYHTSIIALSFIMTLYVFTDYILHKRVYVERYENSPLADTAVIVPSEQPNEKGIFLSSKKSSVARKQSFVTSSSEISQDSSSLLKVDSTAIKVNDEHLVVVEPTIQKRTDSIVVPKIAKLKKTVYINKRDTIVKYDTTRVVKKK